MMTEKIGASRGLEDILTKLQADQKEHDSEKFCGDVKGCILAKRYGEAKDVVTHYCTKHPAFALEPASLSVIPPLLRLREYSHACENAEFLLKTVEKHHPEKRQSLAENIEKTFQQWLDKMVEEKRYDIAVDAMRYLIKCGYKNLRLEKGG